MKEKEGLKKSDKIWVALIVLLIAAFLVDVVFEGLWIGKMIGQFLVSDAEAEEWEGRNCWVLCMPDGYVNLREKPKRNGETFGAATCGSNMLTDEKVRNGFLHVYDLSAEEPEGWISVRYIVYDEPEQVMREMRINSQGRVACRKWIGGKITGWAKDGDAVEVYWMSEEWAVTNRGYIMTEFLE